jgi:hypothetical protein
MSAIILYIAIVAGFGGVFGFRSAGKRIAAGNGKITPGAAIVQLLGTIGALVASFYFVAFAALVLFGSAMSGHETAGSDAAVVATAIGSFVAAFFGGRMGGSLARLLHYTQTASNG